MGCADEQGSLPTGAAGSTSSAAAGVGGSGLAGTTNGAGGTAGGGAAGLGGNSAGSSASAGSSGQNSGGAGGAAGGVSGGAAGGASGGAAGSASGGGGSAGSGASTDCSSLKLCEDFEKALDMSALKETGSGFDGAIVTDQAHSGMHSYHVNAPNKTGSKFLTWNMSPGADFWGRAWFRITGPKGGHQVYIIAKASSELRLFNRKTDKEEMAINTQSGDDWFVSTTPVPQATWFCYEWHVTESATTIYHDGTEAVFTKKPPGIKGVTSLSLGWQRWQAGAAGEMWIDDIAVGDKQIGCQ